MAIPGINDQTPKVPPYFNQALENLKGQGNTQKTKEVLQDAITMLSSVMNLSVQSKTQNTVQQESNTTNGATGVPSIDNPGDPDAVMANLEALLAYLKLENDEKQAEMAKGRIETQKGELEKRHGEQLEKLQESLKQMDKAAKSSLLSKIFGWLMVGLAFVAAGVMSVVTGGLAVGALAGACVGLAMAVLNETGAMDKISEMMVEGLKKLGMSERAATIFTSVYLAAYAIALAVATGNLANAIGNVAGIGATVATTVAKAVDIGVKIGMGAMGIASTAVGVNAAVEGFKSGMAQADVTEMEKFLAFMRQQLEESQEELNAILDQIQSSVSGIIEILNSATDVQLELAQNIV